MVFGRISAFRNTSAASFSAFALLLAGLWLAGCLDRSFAQEKLPLLTRAEAVRRLSTKQAQLSYPVRLHGFVTYYDPDSASANPRIINAIYLRIKALAIQSREEKGLSTLTKIREVHRLTAQEATRGYPVRVQGVITYHNPQLSMTFIQDNSDAIYLQSLNNPAERFISKMIAEVFPLPLTIYCL